MAGHSKWHSIRHKKAANDAKKGKILTKHAKIITIIAQNDPNPETNPALRNVISNAKSDGVPKDNIERILKKAAGGGNDGVIYQEAVYEGFGPHGVPFVVTALTDNLKRSYTDIRTAFMKNNGNLGSTGTVMFQFDHVGVIRFKTDGKTEDEIMELVMASEANDFIYDKEEVEVLTSFTSLGKTRDILLEKKIEIINAQPEYRSKDPQKITDKTELDRLESFIEKIEEVDDVSDVFAGFEPDTSLLS